MPKVSVIIPVYNVEVYLRQCLDSVINQTLKDIEIICVDDGSTDGSSAILAEYAQRDKRMKVVPRDHSNAGAARNAGMGMASGEFLFFCDADDFAEPEMLARMFEAAVKYSADVVCAGKKIYDDASGRIVRTELLPVSMCDAKQPRSLNDEGVRLVPLCGVAPWNKLFKRSFVESHGFFFQEIERSNDLAFGMLTLLLASRVCFLHEAFYVYRTARKGSLQTANSSTPILFADALLLVQSELKRRGEYGRCREAFANAALAHARYNLLSQRSGESFMLLYANLHARILPSLDVDKLPYDGFLYSWDRDFYRIVTGNATPTALFMKLMKERNDRGGEVMSWKERFRKLNKHAERADSDLKAMNNEMTRLNGELAFAREERDRARMRADGVRVKVSVIMAVYNVESFLEEAADSILSQDIGRENLQLVLVDDGSTDGSAALCDSIASRNPGCVTVLHQANAGVAAARNAGLDVALGEYATFTDADDKLTPNACRLACDFLDRHKGKVDIAALPMYFFDAGKGGHILNYKFSRGTRIIDLDKEWNCPQLSMSSAFSRTCQVRQYGFDTRLCYAEDAKCALQIQSRTHRLGVVAEARYLYRKRPSCSSALQNATRRENWYLPPLRHFHQAVLSFFRDAGRPVPKFAQFALAYDLQWRIKQSALPADVLGASDMAEYRNLIAETYRCLEDDIIVSQRHITAVYKLFALKMKYEHDGPEMWRNWLDRRIVRPWLGWLFPRFEFLHRTQTGWRLEGSVLVYEGVDCRNAGVHVDCGSAEFDVPLSKTHEAIRSMGEIIARRMSFMADIPSEKLAPHDFSFSFLFAGRRIPFGGMAYSPHFPVSKSAKASYCYARGLKLSVGADGRFIVKRCGLLRLLKAEFTFLRHIMRSSLPKNEARKAVAARVLYWMARPFKIRRLWLVSDRFNDADDNGEALFRHLCAHPEKGVKAVFVISKASPKFRELGGVGPVVDVFSWRHKIMHLLADCIISSQADRLVQNPVYAADFCRSMTWNKPFVFLQHGITKDDLSRWLNRRNKNFAGFVTAARPEWKSIVDGRYDYDESKVWLTGFPRFDLLHNNASRKILIMPTWRLALADRLDAGTGRWILKEPFAETAYFKFYNGLLNHSGLLDACRRSGYRIVFVIHPNFRAALPLFTVNDCVEVPDGEVRYARFFAEGDLLLTDYSSTAFDFAYLRKPVVYAHFDASSFFSGEHAYEKGYYDYEQDGFGEIETTVDGAAARIIEYMHGGCRTKPKYRSRMDSFFAFSDRENCSRVLDRIRKLGRGGVQ